METTNNSWAPPDGEPKIALISVYEKEGIDTFAKELIALGWKILSSGGTATFLKKAGIEVIDTADLTGLKAMLSHRVATLHPTIHGGLLALKTEEHLAEMKANNIPWIGMVVVDFYPLKDEINREGATTESVIEKTDIGGPTMIRSGVKGRRIVVCDTSDRARVLKWLKAGALNSDNVITALGAKAEAIISEYCMASANFHSKGNYRADFYRIMNEFDY